MELIRHKTYKMFLVEEDDDDRERVLFARVRAAEFKSEPHFSDVMSYESFQTHRYMTHQDVTMTAELIPFADGNYMRIENFMEENEEDDS